MVSSTRRVEVGSSAEQGSSMSSTLGCTARARAMHSRCCWPPDSAPPGESRRSRTSFHSDGPGQRPLDQRVLVVAALQPGQLEPGEDVVADGHGRERVGLLEHHAHPQPDLLGPDALAVDVLAVEEHLAGQRGARHQLVHAVEQAQEGRLAAAGGADERRHLTGGHHQVDALEHEVVAEPGAGVARLERGGSGGRTTRDRAAGGVAGRPRSGRRGRPRAARSLVGGGHGAGVSLRARERRRRSRRATGAGAAVAPDDPGDEEEGEHDQHQHERPGEPALDRGLRLLADALEHEEGQAVLRPGERVGVHQVVAEGGEEEGRRLAHRPGRCRAPRRWSRPERAVGSTTDHTTRARLAPRARPDSRSPSGTRRSTTSTVRVTVGTMIMDSARLAMKPLYPNRPPGGPRRG